MILFWGAPYIFWDILIGCYKSISGLLQDSWSDFFSKAFSCLGQTSETWEAPTPLWMERQIQRWRRLGQGEDGKMGISVQIWWSGFYPFQFSISFCFNILVILDESQELFNSLSLYIYKDDLTNVPHAFITLGFIYYKHYLPFRSHGKRIL